MSQVRRIALLMGQDLGYCRGVLRGVRTYAAHEAQWIFRDASPDSRVLPALREWQPHGIIAHLFDAPFAAPRRRAEKAARRIRPTRWRS